MSSGDELCIAALDIPIFSWGGREKLTRTIRGLWVVAG